MDSSRAQVGIGLRPAHYADVLSGRARPPFVEVISENFLGLLAPGAGGGRPLETLLQVRERLPVYLHGVSLNLGSSDPLDRDYVARLRALADRVQPEQVSDHLCWTGVAGENLHDLLPLPFTEEALDHLSARVAQVQELLGRRLLVENVSSYLTYAHSTMREWEFLTALVRKTGCGLLLDVNNVFVSAANQGFSPEEFLAGVPAEAVLQLHLAGHSRRGALLIDTHDQPVCPEVFALQAEAVRRFGAVPAILERDDRLPAVEELLAEAARAEAVANATLQARGARPQAASASPGPTPAAEQNMAAPSLPALQRWLRWLLTDPRGVEAALEDRRGPFRAPEPEPRLLEAIAPDPPATRPERLDVYAEGYFARLLDALAADHRGVRRLLGAARFQELVAGYLIEHRSRSPSLALAGERLPEFIARSASAAGMPFLADLARLEQSALRALLTDRSERCFDPAASTALERATAALDATVMLLELDWPVLDLFRDRLLPEGEGRAPPPRRRKERLLVWRSEGGVEARRVDRLQWVALLGLRDGLAIAPICARVEEAAKGRAPALARWLAAWVRQAVIAGLSLDSNAEATPLGARPQ